MLEREKRKLKRIGREGKEEKMEIENKGCLMEKGRGEIIIMREEEGERCFWKKGKGKWGWYMEM